MAINSLSELLNAIYEEVREKNSGFGKDAVPLSSQFYPYLSKKFNLDITKIPRLMEMLVNAKMIFSFPVSGDDATDRPGSQIAFVISRGDTIQTLKKRYEENFERLYSHEFQKKMPVDRLFVEFSSKKKEWDNTPLGIAATIAAMLGHYQNYLERNILKFAEKVKERLLAEAIERSEPFPAFLAKAKGGDLKKESPQQPTRQAKEPVKQADAQYDDFKAYAKKNSIEKTLKMYGIEMYTRSRFRDYQFAVIQNLIDEGYIVRANDLKTIKKLLEIKRMTADKDLKIHDFANDINSLMKSINEKLKKLG